MPKDFSVPKVGERPRKASCIGVRCTWSASHAFKDDLRDDSCNPVRRVITEMNADYFSYMEIRSCLHVSQALPQSPESP
jgi:hypothetical protein